MRSHPRVQRDAAAAKAMSVDERRHLAIDPGLGQRRHHDVALPCAVSLALPVLDGAAAADTEMHTERRDPLRACDFDLDQAPAVGMPGYCFRLDGLDAERIGYIDALAD